MWPPLGPLGPSRSALALLAPCCLLLQVVCTHSSGRDKQSKDYQSKTQSAVTSGALLGPPRPTGHWPPPPRPPVGTATKRRSPAILLLPGQPNADHGCPQSPTGHRQYRCPLSVDENRCLNNHQLCNGRSDCPHGEDEHPTMCLFYRFVNDSMRLLVRALLRRDLLQR